MTLKLVNKWGKKICDDWDQEDRDDFLVRWSEKFDDPDYADQEPIIIDDDGVHYPESLAPSEVYMYLQAVCHAMIDNILVGDDEEEPDDKA